MISIETKLKDSEEKPSNWVGKEWLPFPIGAVYAMSNLFRDKPSTMQSFGRSFLHGATKVQL